MPTTAYLDPRGLKRKRRQTTSTDITRQVRSRLHHGLKAVRKAAKKEKAFELQKLIKRKKGTVENKGTDGNYDEQLDILKRLDPERVANCATKTKLAKDKVLSQNVMVQAAVDAELSSNVLVPSRPGTAAAVVESRLLSSKRIAAAILGVLQSLTQCIGQGAEGQIKSVEDVDLFKKRNGKEKSTSHGRAEVDKAQARDHNQVTGQGDDTSEAAEEEQGWESGTVEDGETGNNWESDSVDDAHPQHISTELEGDATEDDGYITSDNESSAQPARKRKIQADKSRPITGDSAFLPSLSVGFTRGDSDASDWSDAEADVADGVRKNRRGQRARRAIWEKKYGKNANHVKKAQQATSKEAQPFNRAKGSSSSPGGGGQTDRRGPRPSHFQSNPPLQGKRRDVPGDRPPNGAPQPSHPKRQEDKPLHPSWEAKKRMKQKQNTSILPAQGTKITFD